MKNNFMDMPSMIKATCAFTAALFIFTGCGGSGDTATTGDTSSTSSITPALASTPPQTSSNPSLKIASIEEKHTTDVSTTITWELTEEGTGQIEYGFDTSYGDVSIKEESFNYSKHTQRLSDLEPNSIYHYRIISEDVDGNRVVSEDRISKTKNDGTVLLEPVPTQEPSTTTPVPADVGIITAPDGATVITGLKTGATEAAAKNNSDVLNSALGEGGKNLTIPSGTWYTYSTVVVNKNTTLTFKGSLQQLKHSDNNQPYHRHLMLIQGGNVILNNPHLSQKGIIGKHGTHSCLAIYGKYNTGNITINGGILEHGASNCFQGGVDNTVFNGTIFRDSVEHLVYAAGARRENPSDPDMRPDGLIFNNCVMERPGNGLTADLEANHIQLRSYKNIEINNCIIQGKKKTSPSQYGILVTGVQGLTVNDTTIKDYSAGLLYAGTAYNYTTRDVVFTNVTASGTRYILKSHSGVNSTFNNLTIDSPLGVSGGTSSFNNCTFKPTSTYMKISKNAKVTFDDSTWDYSKSTYSKAFVKEAGSTVTFIGTQTKIEPEDGRSFSWGLLSTVN